MYTITPLLSSLKAAGGPPEWPGGEPHVNGM